MPPRKISPNRTSIDVCDFTRSDIDRAIAKLRYHIQEVTNLHPSEVPFDDARYPTQSETYGESGTRSSRPAPFGKKPRKG